jgi:hypothetical protein
MSCFGLKQVHPQGDQLPRGYWGLFVEQLQTVHSQGLTDVPEEEPQDLVETVNRIGSNAIYAILAAKRTNIPGLYSRVLALFAKHIDTTVHQAIEGGHLSLSEKYDKLRGSLTKVQLPYDVVEWGELFRKVSDISKEALIHKNRKFAAYSGYESLKLEEQFEVLLRGDFAIGRAFAIMRIGSRRKCVARVNEINDYSVRLLLAVFRGLEEVDLRGAARITSKAFVDGHPTLKKLILTGTEITEADIELSKFPQVQVVNDDVKKIYRLPKDASEMPASLDALLSEWESSDYCDVKDHQILDHFNAICQDRSASTMERVKKLLERDSFFRDKDIEKAIKLKVINAIAEAIKSGSVTGWEEEGTFANHSLQVLKRLSWYHPEECFVNFREVFLQYTNENFRGRGPLNADMNQLQCIKALIPLTHTSEEMARVVSIRLKRLEKALISCTDAKQKSLIIFEMRYLLDTLVYYFKNLNQYVKGPEKLRERIVSVFHWILENNTASRLPRFNPEHPDLVKTQLLPLAIVGMFYLDFGIKNQVEKKIRELTNKLNRVPRDLWVDLIPSQHGLSQKPQILPEYLEGTYIGSLYLSMGVNSKMAQNVLRLK